MSDDAILIKMSQQIGRLEGSMQEMARSQQQTNERIATVLEKQDGRINSLEDDRSKTKGFIIGTSAAGGTVASGIFLTLAKLFGGS